jgi:predicted dehydrogenase
VDAIGVPVLGEREDAAQARLEFADGCVANLSASRVSFSEAPNRRMHLWSPEGFAEIDFGRRSVKVVTPCDAVRHGEFDFNALPPQEKAGFKERVFADVLRLEPIEFETRNALADELRDFVDSIRERRQPRVTGYAGREALAVAEAVVDSARNHRWRAEPPTPPILRGPHWLQSQPVRTRREAG